MIRVPSQYIGSETEPLRKREMVVWQAFTCAAIAASEKPRLLRSFRIFVNMANYMHEGLNLSSSNGSFAGQGVSA